MKGKQKLPVLTGVLLCIVLWLALMPAVAQAAEDAAKGEGWRLDSEGCLHITGAVNNPGTGKDWTPWKNVKGRILSVVAEKGSSVNYASFLFSDCPNLRTVDLTGLTLKNYTTMFQMFSGCSSLREINMGNIDTLGVENMDDMLKGCTSLMKVRTYFRLPVRMRSVLAEISPVWINSLNGEVYEGENALAQLKGPMVELIAPAVYGEGWWLDKAGNLFLAGAITNTTFATDKTPWAAVKDQILTVVALPGSSINNGTFLFSNCSNLVSARLASLDTTGVVDMYGMFSNCSSLNEVYFYFSTGIFDTSSVEDMSNMFYNCSSLTYLDVCGLEIHPKCDLTNMFLGCSNLDRIWINPEILRRTAYQLKGISWSWSDYYGSTTYFDAEDMMDITEVVCLKRMCYPVRANAEGKGSVEVSSENAMVGTYVSLTPKPIKGNHFYEWKTDGITMSRSGFFMPDRSVEITAVFMPHTESGFDNGDGTHRTVCVVCEEACETAQAHTFGLDGTCSVCGAQKLLTTPKLIKLENAATGVKVTWDAVEGAEMYRLMYKEPGGSFVTGGYTTGTSYTVKNLASGVEYFFTVRCMTADKKTNTSDYDRVGTPITYIAAPVLQKVENASNGVKLTWDLSAGAELYKVMYKEAGGSYKTAGYTTSNNYTVTGLTAGAEYTFTVRCLTADKKTYTSSYNSTGLSLVYQPAAAKLATPVITKLENASTGVKATWDAVEGAEMYRLMYKEPGGSFVTGGYTTGTSYTVKNLTSGVTYAFTVRCMTADKKTNTSDYDRVGTPITYIAAPALKSVENTANGVKVTWDLSAGAELYKVMYKEPGGSYKTAGYTTSNSYTVTGLTAGVEYTFTARCIMADKKTYTSSYDSKGLTLVYQPTATKLATPVITKLENTNSGVKVTWGAVEGAEMYRLMYKEPDGTFKTGGYTTGTGYTVKEVTGGVTYAFTVRCMTADKKTNTSDYDKVGTSITYIAPPVLTKVYNTASGVKVTWQASAGAELYKVMYKEEGGSWKTGGYSTSTGYTVKNLTEGTAYAFTVRCMTADKSTYTSGYDKTGLSITYVKP